MNFKCIYFVINPFPYALERTRVCGRSTAGGLPEIKITSFFDINKLFQNAINF